MSGNPSSTPIHATIPLPIQAIRDFCEHCQINRLELFGSVLHEDFGPDSDIDPEFRDRNR